MGNLEPWTKPRGGTTLIIDRYSYSGVAFSSTTGFNIEWCKAPEKGLLAPDLVVYHDIPPEKAAERGGYGGERYEQLEFRGKVAQHYQMLHDATWKIVDACRPIEDIEKQLIELAMDCVSTCHKGKPLSQLWLTWYLFLAGCYSDSSGIWTGSFLGHRNGRVITKRFLAHFCSQMTSRTGKMISGELPNRLFDLGCILFLCEQGFDLIISL
ncbi:thymidylate kinase-like [Macadamia integrifolia]|uniref:thymidylate kinase-like n=1 Tax=Macadamia integrifolia TaxID=60698 RepID=UPI001C4F40F1|nr:thymidylate kinase-like [Macadamia integrifolia]